MNMAPMSWPKFCIINGERAVKAVPTEDGGLAVLEYRPESDDYQGAVALLHRFSVGDTDTELVSEQEFELFIAQQRAEVKRRRATEPRRPTE